MFEIEALIEDRRLLLALLLLNLGGVLAGFQFYSSQMGDRPLWHWPLVADCPLAAFLFSLFLAMVLLKKRRSLLGALAFTSLLKYGFWTLMVLALHPSHYFGSDLLYYSLIAIFHVVMMAEAFAVVHFQRFTVVDVLFSLLLLLANDTADYFFGTVPVIPATHLESIRAVAFISTFLVCREALKFTRASERASALLRGILPRMPLPLG